MKQTNKTTDYKQICSKADYEKQKEEIRKRLKQQFPNKFVDEEEPQPEPEKPKSDIDKVFNHVHQLLTNDEFLEDYFLCYSESTKT